MVDDGKQSPASKKKATPDPGVSKPKSSTSQPAPQKTIAESPAGKPGTVSSKFTDVLFGAMERANLEGFDYLEFKQSLKSLEKMPMDEATRYQSAFAMAKTMGATPKKLVDTAGHYVRVLQKEEKKFEEALNNQKTKQIGQKRQQVEQLDKVIQEKAKQIEQLTKEIEQHKQKITSLKMEVNNASSKVESTKNDFIASYNAIVAQIQNDVEAMQKYLK